MLPLLKHDLCIATLSQRRQCGQGERAGVDWRELTHTAQPDGYRCVNIDQSVIVCVCVCVYTNCIHTHTHTLDI